MDGPVQWSKRPCTGTMWPCLQSAELNVAHNTFKGKISFIPLKYVTKYVTSVYKYDSNIKLFGGNIYVIMGLSYIN